MYAECTELRMYIYIFIYFRMRYHRMKSPTTDPITANTVFLPCFPLIT